MKELFLLVRIAIFVTILAECVVVTRAQTVEKDSSGAQLQYSALAGSGKTITATRVPVVTFAGKTIYQDITLHFDADLEGRLTLTSGYPIVVPSPDLQVLFFRAGRYLGSRNIANGKAFVTVGGPSVTGGGTAWSLLSTDDADKCTYPGSATWYVGPVENNPQSARLMRAGSNAGGADRQTGITSSAWSYGVSGGAPSPFCDDTPPSPNPSGSSNNWENGSLIGVSQSGNTLTIASFTKNGIDYSSPVDQITYVLAP